MVSDDHFVRSFCRSEELHIYYGLRLAYLQLSNTMVASTLITVSTTSFPTQGRVLKTWLPKPLQRSTGHEMGDGAVTEKDGECDPTPCISKIESSYRCICSTPTPISRSDTTDAEPKWKAERKVNASGLRKVSAMDSMSLLLTSSVKAGVSHTKWKRKVNA